MNSKIKEEKNSKSSSCLPAPRINTYLKIYGDGCSSLESVSSGILNHGVAVGVGLPDVLLVVVVLGGDDNLVGDQESGVESHAKLTNQIAELRRGGRVLQLAQEICRARLGDCSQIVDEISLGHTDTGVRDVQHVVVLVSLDLDAELLRGVQHRFVGEGEQADLVQGVGGVGDQFSQEDLLVAIQRVDDQLHHAVDLSLVQIFSYI